MANDYRNSLGFLSLQLKAKAQERQALEQQAIRQEQREREVAGEQNTMKLGQLAVQQLNEQENRKLQLAGMLQKAAETNDVKVQLERMKEDFVRPKQDSEIEKNKATAGLSGAKAIEVPLESARRDADLGRKEADTESNIDHRKQQDVNQRYSINMGFLGRFAQPGVYGRRGLQIDQNLVDRMMAVPEPSASQDTTPSVDVPGRDGVAPGSQLDYILDFPKGKAPPQTRATPSVATATVPPPGDPNVQLFRPADAVKNAQAAQGASQSVERLKGLRDKAAKMDPANWGLLGGRGPANWGKDLLAQGQTVAQALGLMDKGQTDTQRLSGERAELEGEFGTELAQKIHDFSGASSNEGEARRIAMTRGISPADLALFQKDALSVFSKDQPTFLKILDAAIEFEDYKARELAANQAAGGIRVSGGPAPQASAPAPDVKAQRNQLFEELVNGGMDKAEARQKVYERFPK